MNKGSSFIQWKISSNLPFNSLVEFSAEILIYEESENFPQF